MTHRRRAVVDHTSRPFLPLALLLALLLGGTFVVLAAAPAHAVTPVASEPRDRQKVSQAPGAVTLAFSRDVDPSVAKIVVLGPNGENVTSGPLIVEGTNVTSQLREGLDRGTYTVHYRIDGRDGEPEGGAYQFAVGNGSFTDLPDKSWSGEDDEPAVLSGTNPNGSDAPEPTTAPNTPGIEVTSQAATSEPPPPTDPPSTVQAPPGPTTDEASSDETSASATPEADAGGSGGAPWIIGGVILLLAVAGTVFGLWHKNKESAAPGHD